ncbi:MAG: toxin-antitoxin system, antitoxin component, Xre family protein [Betaproteobacteria bacterium RIFCSPLOWO2_12_FULL_68_20]|nr:MAG: toxin-antitoxin system, antitoxin component, Xre family protein [Betaproteobacteria bacterium RIFCSPLOWO2_12_FULL_68_20]
MNQRDPQELIEKLKTLPPERLAEVADFVEFLRARDQARALERAATRASEPAFAKVWENDADAAYDRL